MLDGGALMEYTFKELTFLWYMIPLAYLIGSVPTAVWVGKTFHNIDVRDHGSGNAGATNVIRVLGMGSGIPVLLIDLFKGWAAVSLLYFQQVLAPDKEAWMLFSILLGILAVTGHILPVFAGFRGGKGVATIAGVCLALHPIASLSALGVFVLVLVLSNYVSVASMLAGLSFPGFVLLYHPSHISLLVFAALLAVLLIYTHRKNIQRLINGNENKASGLLKRGKGQ